MAGNKHTARNCAASIAKADSIVGVGLAPTLSLTPPTLSGGPDFVRLNCMLVCSYTCTCQSLHLSYHSFSHRAIHVNLAPEVPCCIAWAVRGSATNSPGNTYLVKCGLSRMRTVFFLIVQFFENML